MRDVEGAYPTVIALRASVVVEVRDDRKLRHANRSGDT